MMKEFKISECFNRCEFFFSPPMDAMECVHPYFEGKGPYDGLIITHKNSHDGNIPEKCPLRKEKLTTTYELEDKNKISYK